MPRYSEEFKAKVIEAHKRYEFGVKVGVVASLRKPFILAAHALPGRPYDGRTLMRSLARATLNTGVKIKTAVADKGYRGHEAWPGARIVLPGQRSGTPGERRWRRTRLRRRSVIEALIGHMKVDGLMGPQLAEGHGRRQCIAAQGRWNSVSCRRPCVPATASPHGSQEAILAAAIPRETGFLLASVLRKSDPRGRG